METFIVDSRNKREKSYQYIWKMGKYVEKGFRYYKLVARIVNSRLGISEHQRVLDLNRDPGISQYNRGVGIYEHKGYAT